MACNTYASDYSKGYFPSFKVGSQPGENVTDVAANFITNMAAYGMAPMMYFCPARTTGAHTFTADSDAFYSTPGIHHYIKTVHDLTQYYISVNTYGNYIILDNILIWIPRTEAENNYYPYYAGLSDPNNSYDPETCYNPIDITNGGWPLKQSDQTVSREPVVSDYCLANGKNTNVSAIDPGTGHFFNGKLSSVNAGFGDGHVETHSPARITWHMEGNAGEETWFY